MMIMICMMHMLKRVGNVYIRSLHWILHVIYTFIFFYNFYLTVKQCEIRLTKINRKYNNF